MAKKKQVKKDRSIYDRNFYKAQATLRDPWFIERVAWLKKRFAETDCPIPEKGFKLYSVYLEWNKHFWRRYVEMEKSPEFIAAKQRITGGKERFSAEEFYELEDFREEFLPPVYGSIFDEILKHFGIKTDNRGFQDFLEMHVFFGQQEYATVPFDVSLKRNKETEPFGLYVQIYGHTKKEDIEQHWDWIAGMQKHLPDFIGKNKAWDEFDRDTEIYALAKTLREKSGRERETSWRAVDKDIWAQLHKKYPRLTIANIRTIVSRTAKRLGEI